jgi:hypothetical protein
VRAVDDTVITVPGDDEACIYNASNENALDRSGGSAITFWATEGAPRVTSDGGIANAEGSFSSTIGGTVVESADDWPGSLDVSGVSGFFLDHRIVAAVVLSSKGDVSLVARKPVCNASGETICHDGVAAE